MAERATIARPYAKAAFAAAGLGWKGHTDLLAHLCGVSDVAMMFHSPKLRVRPVTIASASPIATMQAAKWLRSVLISRCASRCR